VIGLATIVLAVFLIARLTLRSLGGTLPAAFDWCVLVCGSYGGADFLDNLILFIPLGIGLRLAGVPAVIAWIGAALLSGSIEAAQYYVIPGRDSSLGDLVANSTGAAVGIALANSRRRLLAPIGTEARRAGLAAAVAVALLAAGVQWLSRPRLPRTEYWVQIAARLPQFAPFRGAVLDPAINGTPAHAGRLDQGASTALRQSLIDGTSRLSATIVPDTTNVDFAPVLSVFDNRRVEIVVFGCRDRSLLERVRTRAAAVRLHPMTLDAAAGDPCRAGDTTAIEARPGAAGDVALRVSRAGTVAAVTVPPIGVWLGWELLIPFAGPWARHRALVTLLSMAALFAMLGYPIGRAWLDDRDPRWILLAAVTTVGALAIIPWAAGTLPAPRAVWLVSASALVVAWKLAQWRIDRP
jgi:hypothetical protein